MSEIMFGFTSRVTSNRSAYSDLIIQIEKSGRFQASSTPNSLPLFEGAAALS